MKRALLYLFIFIVIQFFATWMVLIIWTLISSGSIDNLVLVLKGESGFTSSELITSSALSSLITIILFIRLKWVELSFSWIKSNNYDILVLSAIVSIGTILPSIWFQEQFPSLPDSMEETFKMIMDNPFGYLMICLFAPLVEEVVFRGAILRSLLCSIKSHWIAILISAIAFALVHGNLAQMPHALAVGVLLGWMYYRTKSILPGVMLHWVNNTIAYIAYMLSPDSIDEKLIDVFNGNNLYLELFLALSLLLLIVSIYLLNKRMKKNAEFE